MALCPTENKEQFPTPADADAEIERRGWVSSSRCYHCPHCGQWHITALRMPERTDYTPMQDRLRQAAIDGRTAIVAVESANVRVHRYKYLDAVWTFRYNRKKKTVEIISVQ